MKDKFIETFGYIDPKLVADAKPMAEKPLELRTEPSRFSWKKLTAAAACVAVLGVGSAAVIKAAGSGNAPAVDDSAISGGVSLSAADSGHSDVIDELIDSSSIIDNTTDDTNFSSSPDSFLVESDGSHPSMLKYSDGDVFECEGKSYKVMSGSGGWGLSLKDESDTWEIVSGSEFVVGVRREIIDGVDTVEFAAFVENVGTTPIGLMSSTASPDMPVIFRFKLNDRSTEVADSHNWFEGYEFRYMPYVIQPGERFYQTASFPVTEAEYMFSVCYYETDPDRFDESNSFKENSKGGSISNTWVDFSDTSVSFDDVYTLFGASNYGKEVQAAWESRQ